MSLCEPELYGVLLALDAEMFKYKIRYIFAHCCLSLFPSLLLRRLCLGWSLNESNVRKAARYPMQDLGSDVLGTSEFHLSPLIRGL